MFLSMQEVPLKTATIIASAGLMMLGTLGLAQAQTSGTPGSPFPNAAPHEVQMINGVPCRTILDRESNQRVPVQCASSAGMIGMDPTTTGSVLVAPGARAPVSGTPASACRVATASRRLPIGLRTRRPGWKAACRARPGGSS